MSGIKGKSGIYKRTDISKKNMSDSHKGQKAWNKGLKMIDNNPNYKNAKGMLGKTVSDETRIKISKKMKGNKTHLWKGGITIISQSIRKIFKYRQWRSDIFTRDNFTCQECGANKCYIEAHHIKLFSVILKENNIKTVEEAENCEELWNINNGITLCKKCHDKTKGYGK